MRFQLRNPEAIVQDLEAATRLVSLVREAAPAHGQFDLEYLEPIAHLAAQVAELPLLPEHHGEPGGLLRYAVQAGYFALRLADGVVFGADLGAEARRVVEVQSRRAAFLAALGSAVPLCHESLTVRSEDGEPWSEFARPLSLSEWAASRGGAYTITWRATRQALPRSVAIWLAAEFIALYMGGFRREVALGAMAALCPAEAMTGAPSPLERIVRQALQSSAELARKRELARYRPPGDAALPGAQEFAAQIASAPTPPGPAAPEAPSQPATPAHAPVPQPLAEAALAKPQTPAVPSVAQPELHLEGGAVAATLEALPAGVRQLLELLAEDIRTKEGVRKRVSWDDAGWLLVDQALLGHYGMGQPAAVAALLKRARIAQEGNGRALRIVADIGAQLLPRKAA